MVDYPLLVDGEAIDGEVNTYVLVSSSRIDRCAQPAWKLPESSSPVAMADDGGRAVVRQCPPVTICSSEVLYSYVVTYWS